MTVVDVSHLSYSYRRQPALDDVSFTVPEGATYALLGPNGSGKTTLLQLIAGIRRRQSGEISLGVERGQIGYVAEGQKLPGWMRLGQMEAYVAPLYDTWDPAVARNLRDRFALDARRKIRTLSRGEYMKAALLCALAPRPKLLLMDEPFTGLDAAVKIDLVAGLLSSVGSEGTTVVITSHDIGELEMLSNWAGFIKKGRMQVSEPLDQLLERYAQVSVVLDDASLAEQRPGDDWLSVERSARRLSSLFTHPYTKIQFVERDLDVSRITATKYLNLLADGGILRKHRVGRGYYYINEGLVNILTSEGGVA